MKSMTRARLAPKLADDLHRAKPGTVVVGTKRSGTPFYDPAPFPNVLQHDELYAAYPGLAQSPPDTRATGANVGAIVTRGEGEAIAATKPSIDQVPAADRDPDTYGKAQYIEIYVGRAREALPIALHEGNHGVQHFEGFSAGSSPEAAGSFAAYQLLPGEMESRAVEWRRTMAPEERRATPPWVTMDAIKAKITENPDRRPLPPEGPRGAAHYHPMPVSDSPAAPQSSPATPGTQPAWTHPDGRKDSQGLSPNARDIGGKPDVQREAWDAALRGMLDPVHSTPELREWAQQQLDKADHGFKPWDANEQQRRLDAIHSGSGGKSDGRGQVFDGPGDPPPYEPEPPRVPVPKRFKGSDLGGPMNVAGFAAAAHAFHSGTVRAPTASADANHRRGFQNPNNLRAALAAQGKASTNVKG